jgi:hypothetical protein
MANCDLTQLISDSSCLNCLSETEKKSAYLYYLAKALLASGGTDYTDLNTLREAVQCWCVGGQVLDSFKTRMAINIAYSLRGISATPTVAEIRDAIKCWPCGIGGYELQAMEVLLLCNLLESQTQPD